MRYHEIDDQLKLPTLEVGDEILVGKFKNRKATITGFFTDDNGQPVLKTTKGDQKLFKPRIAKLIPKAPGDLSEAASHGITAIVYHGSYKKFDKFDVDPHIGSFFTDDLNYAKTYGSKVYKCKVHLANPLIRDALDINTRYTSNRELLIDEGYDGYVVKYQDGAKDIVAFYPEQIQIISVMSIP